jgi:hypothetical protein
MRNISLEKPEAVFLCAPVVEDICIEFGVDRTDAETITCMYEVFKRVSGNDHFVWDEDAYNEGYKEGWNDAIEEAESRVDDISWEIGTLKKQ